MEWNETLPSGEEPADTIADIIKDKMMAIQERLEGEHIFNNDEIGKHKAGECSVVGIVTSLPTTVTNNAIIIKDGLFYVGKDNIWVKMTEPSLGVWPIGSGVGVLYGILNDKIYYRCIDTIHPKDSIIVTLCDTHTILLSVNEGAIDHANIGGIGTISHVDIEYKLAILQGESYTYYTHGNNYSNPHGVNKNQVGLANVSNALQLEKAAGSIQSLISKVSCANDDIFMIEDSADGYQKKSIKKSNLGIVTGAPTEATYITKTPHTGLTAGQALSVLSTGLLKNTIGTGVLEIAVAGSDFVVPNAVIIGETKTKITYDTKGLVTAGANATQDDIIDGTTNKQYSNTEKTKLASIAPNANNYVHPNHTGDITSMGDGVTTISNAVVTNTKLFDMPSKTYKGRTDVGIGAVSDISVAVLKSDLALNKGDVGLDQVANVTQLARNGNDYPTFITVTPAGEDKILIEDASDLFNKKVVLISSLPSGVTDHTALSNIGVNSHPVIDVALSNSLTHQSNVNNPHSTNKAQIGLDLVTNDAQLKRSGNDYSSIVLKATPNIADVILIEDSQDAYTKKRLEIGSITTGAAKMFQMHLDYAHFGGDTIYLETISNTRFSTGITKTIIYQGLLPVDMVWNSTITIRILYYASWICSVSRLVQYKINVLSPDTLLGNSAYPTYEEFIANPYQDAYRTLSSIGVSGISLSAFGVKSIRGNMLQVAITLPATPNAFDVFVLAVILEGQRS
ncbi:MAG: hypothetical protein KJ769_08375 [Candidatus Margulisbacteria bacterium]|nr:hypothetical protein [Candidatus Margulisiibacteriota bacterium]